MAGTRKNKLTTISKPWLGLMSQIITNLCAAHTLLTQREVFTTDR